MAQPQAVLNLIEHTVEPDLFLTAQSVAERVVVVLSITHVVNQTVQHTLGVMKLTHQQQNDFLSHKPLPGVRFEHDAYVNVTSGPNSGDSGSIISVEELGADPLYLVELESGKDALISQSSLQLHDT